MKTTVELSEQVRNFVRSLAPEPRRSLPLKLMTAQSPWLRTLLRSIFADAVTLHDP